MKLLIDDWNGKTIEVDLGDCMGYTSGTMPAKGVYPKEDVLYANGIPCRLSTARSLEAEAVKEAAELFVDVMKRNEIADGAESIDNWLGKWTM